MPSFQELSQSVEKLKQEVNDLKRENQELKNQPIDEMKMREFIVSTFNNNSDFIRFLKNQLQFDNIILRKRPSTASVDGNDGTVFEILHEKDAPNDAHNYIYIGRRGTGENRSTDYMELSVDTDTNKDASLRNGRFLVTVSIDESTPNASILAGDERGIFGGSTGSSVILLGQGTDGRSGIGHGASTYLTCDATDIDLGADMTPDTDNQYQIGTASKRLSDLRSVLINGADIGFEHDWWLTEGYKVGIEEDGIAILNNKNELKAFIGENNFYTKDIKNIDDLPYVKTTVRQRAKMNAQNKGEPSGKDILELPDPKDAKKKGGKYKEKVKQKAKKNNKNKIKSI